MDMQTISKDPQKRYNYSNGYGTSNNLSTQELLKEIRDFLKTLSVGAFEIGTFMVQVPVLVAKLSSVQQNRVTASDFAEIYNKTPKLLVNGLKSKLLVAVKTKEIDDSLESILRRYMKMAQLPSNVSTNINNGVHSILRVLDIIGNFLHWKGDLVDLYEDTQVIPFPSRPSLLATLWAFMLAELIGPSLQYSGSENTLERIARLSIALTLGVLTGATGYFHAGGSAAGVKSPLSLIGTYYNVQHRIKDNSPNSYNKIPSCLLLPSVSTFDKLLSLEKISAAKGLNMAYTFRVGDSFLKTMEGHTYTSDSLLLDVMRKMWPLVSESEATRMYELYVKEERLYFL